MAIPSGMVTDRAPALRAAIEGLIPAAFHNTEQYANNRVECDHGWLKARLRPMRGLKRDNTARVIVRGHALMQNIRRVRFLVDANLSPRVAAALNHAGFDAVHIFDRRLGAASDHAILEAAFADDRTIISSDTDFGEH